MLQIFGYIATAVFGLLFGSFLNVCILRIPAGESVVTGPSHCPKCDRRLRFYELFPVFSWLAQRGRCRGCGDKISAQYPLVEAANAALWVAAAVLCGTDFELPYDCALLVLRCAVLSALFGLSVIDARTGEIPFGFNAFIGICAVLRFVAAAVLAEGFGLGTELLLYGIGGVAVSVPLGVIYVVSGGRALGGGDIKLLAAVGLFLGWRLVLFGFFAACLIGSVTHLVRMRVSGAGRELKLGPYLAVGLTLAMFFGHSLINLYLNSIRSI